MSKHTSTQKDTYATVDNNEYLNNICVVYCNSKRKKTSQISFENVPPVFMAKKIAAGLNLIDFIENNKLNSLTKQRLIESLQKILSDNQY